ncbi:MAG TPA: UDP-N-acetylglucosamine 1-carboxyvinyltransferase [Limnochordia bacterium]|nr:UDP-N-acetylglucosamine 1-carboxyvinyltransferase [Limnochordia bacterium]
MERIVIQGGRRLVGQLAVSGAKNAVLKLMVASLLADGASTIHHVPLIDDVRNMMKLLTALGARVELGDDGVMRIDTSGPLSTDPPDELVRSMRASIQVLGPLLSRFGEVRMALPGGCNIGDRPIDFHLGGLRKLGAEIVEEHGAIIGRCRRLKGTEIHLDFPSVGATENLMMAAVYAEGTTILRNVAKEPEIVEVQNFINKMGGNVFGAGTDSIRIRGVGSLAPAAHDVIPDRIEAGTYMLMAAVTRGDVTLEPVIADHVEPVIAKLREAGVQVDVEDERVRVRAEHRPRAIEMVRVAPHPGFPTDMHPPIAALLAYADGLSSIQETVYTNRFRYAEELRRLGMRSTVRGDTLVITGSPVLQGANVTATDLRAGAALVVAALGAQGETVIDGVHHLDRGYERLEEKLTGLGAIIKRQHPVTV